MEGYTSSGRAARALFPQGRSCLVSAAAAASSHSAGGGGYLQMVLFCGERPLPAFLPQDAAAVAKVHTPASLSHPRFENSKSSFLCSLCSLLLCSLLLRRGSVTKMPYGLRTTRSFRWARLSSLIHLRRLALHCAKCYDCERMLRGDMYDVCAAAGDFAAAAADAAAR